VRLIKNLFHVKYHLFLLILELFIGTIILLLVYNNWAIPNGKKIFFIPASTQTTSLYKTLADNNYSMHLIDKLILPFVTQPQEGWYEVEQSKLVQSNESRLSFFASLHLKKTKTKTVKIYAGETAAELSKRLSKNLDLNTSKLIEAYKKRTLFGQGDIFSSLYNIAPYADEESVIRYLFYHSHSILKKFEQEYENITNNRLEHKILLTIASIIQKESNSAEEMPRISSVIYNRLKKNMRLQMDSTLNYGKFSHEVVNSDRIKTDTTTYNTYKHKGLPPAPLCTVSIEALKAAYLPQTTKYLFFMLNKKGTHNFAVTYKEHLENIRKFKTKPKKEKQHTQKIKHIKPIPIETSKEENLSISSVQ